MSNFVKILIVDDNNNALFHHYLRAGYWGLPGGKVEQGEEPIFAAQRELLERSGYYVDMKELILTANNKELSLFKGFKKDLIPKSLPGELGGYVAEIKWQPLWNRDGKLFRYTSEGEGIFNIGKRLLPEGLIDEAWQARRWMPKPILPEGDYRFFLTPMGKEKYESTLLLIHEKYLSGIHCETIDPAKVGPIIYEDEYQVVTVVK